MTPTLTTYIFQKSVNPCPLTHLVPYFIINNTIILFEIYSVFNIISLTIMTRNRQFMPWVSPAINLRTKQKDILTGIVNSRTARCDHQKRAQLILYFDQGLSNIKAAKAVSLQPKQASQWRHRWLSNEETLLAVETNEHTKSNTLKSKIEETLSDLPRSGKPPTFTALQVSQILAVACETPQDSGLPLSHWSLPALQLEVIKRKIVKSISKSTLHVFLKSGRIKTS